jgi:hypothetical protein
MKAEIIRDDIEIHLPAMRPGHEDCWEYREIMRNGEMTKVPFWKKGAVIDFPDCWRLVQMGCAVPADDGCLKRANRNPDELAAAQKAYERVRLGIHPEDYELFDAGVIVGYEGNGDYKPGPNWDRYQAEQAALTEGDDDDGA